VGLVEKVARGHDIEFPVQRTIATTDGNHTWAFRYSSEGRSRSLFYSTDVSTLRHQYPDNPMLHEPSHSETSAVTGGRCRKIPAWSFAEAPRRCTPSRPWSLRTSRDCGRVVSSRVGSASC
jgi:glutamine amidotransferase